MKQLRNFIKLETALIPVDIKSSQQLQISVALKSLSISNSIQLFLKAKELFSVMDFFPWQISVLDF